jgi:uncharacterized protein YydD (DUF2326 family)
MIIALGSSMPTFKTLRFHKGLNILLAEQETRSSDTETRNGSGKSSTIHLIHFLLGGSITRDSMLKADALQDHSFWGEFEFNGNRVRVERRVASPKTVTIRGDNLGGLESDGQLFEDRVATNDAWCRWLGHVIFRLPLKQDGTPFDVTHAPTFRSLFPYFARRREDIGFHTPDKFAARAQSMGSSQIALSYLFGLDWHLARDFELEREEKRNLEARRKRIKARQPENLRGSSAIRSAMLLAAHEAEVQRDRVASFQVAEHYEDLVREASGFKAQLEKLSLEATSLKSSLRYIEESLETEQPADGEAIEELYRAAGTQLPGTVVKTFDEIAAFHRSVADNRRHHLASQRDSLQRRLAAVNSEMTVARTSRDAILRDLRGKGAFSEFASMQQRLAQKEEQHARLQTQYQEALEIEKGNSASKINESNLLARLQQDLAQRESAVSAAVLAVLEAQTTLYGNRVGAFEIRANANGPEFKVSIDGDRAGGISNMEIFCFDYALFRITTDRFGGPGMLVHDSHLFEPVDSRQVATAIQLGSQLADDIGGQYIVMLNSDIYERLPFDEDFNAGSKLMTVRLDDTETGGLFGVKFS